MSSSTVLERILALIRKLRAEEPPITTGTGPYRTQSIDHLASDMELVSFIRHHGEGDKDLAVSAIRRIANNLRVQILAMDPDLPPYIRIAALGKLGPSADSLRIMIARTDHDPAVAIVAIQTLHDRTRVKDAYGSVHDVVNLFLRTKYALA